MKPACVCSGLSQSARTVHELAEEAGQSFLPGVPLQTLVLGPGSRVVSEGLIQVPGQDVGSAPEPRHIPEDQKTPFKVTIKV